MTTPNIDTKALRELEAKATEGRWHVLREGPGEINVYPEAWRGKPNVERYALIARFSPWDGASQDDRDEVMAQANANVALIVALRNAAPALLDLADRAQGADEAIADLQAHVARAEDALWDRNEERLAVREALGLKCRTVEEDMGCGCLMFSAADRAREIVAERDALKARVAYYESALCFTPPRPWALPPDGVVTGTIEPERVSEVLAERDALKAEVERLRAAQTYLDVVFDGPPSHESGRFVEVENLEGFSVGAGEWIDRGNGLWALRLPVLRAALRGEEASRE